MACLDHIIVIIRYIKLLRDRRDANNCALIIRQLCNTRDRSRQAGQQNVLGKLTLDICWTTGTNV